MGIGFGFGLGPLRIYIPLISGGRGRRPRGKYWTHKGCTIHHRSEDAADRCKIGRAVAPKPIAATPRDWAVFDHADPKAMLRTSAELVFLTQYASPSLLTTKLKISHKDAQDILQQMEELKFLGPQAESMKPRDVLIPASGAQTILELIDKHVEVTREP